MSIDVTGRPPSDTEREQVVAALVEQVGAGHLALSEFEVRVGAAYSVLKIEELRLLTEDISMAPASEPGSPVSPWHRWLLTCVICLVIWLATSLSNGEMMSFWPGWVIGPWGAVLLVRRLTGQQEACS